MDRGSGPGTARAGDPGSWPPAHSGIPDRDLLGASLCLLGQAEAEDAALKDRLDRVGIDRLGEDDGPLEPAEDAAIIEILTALGLVPLGLDREDVAVDRDLEVFLEDPRHLRLDVEVSLILPNRQRHVAPRPALPRKGLRLIAEDPV